MGRRKKKKRMETRGRGPKVRKRGGGGLNMRLRNRKRGCGEVHWGAEKIGAKTLNSWKVITDRGWGGRGAATHRVRAHKGSGILNTAATR